jgi:hypothetical protein
MTIISSIGQWLTVFMSVNAWNLNQPINAAIWAISAALFTISMNLSGRS